jgi:hypothetical protein
MRYGCLLLVLVTFYACQWNADEEKQINTVINRYIFAENNGLMLSKAGLTHPDFLKSILRQEDTTFLAHFQQRRDWYDPILKDRIKKGNNWQVSFQLRQRDSDSIQPPQRLYIVSEDAGKNWFVLESEFYENHKIVPHFKRHLHHEN